MSLPKTPTRESADRKLMAMPIFEREIERQMRKQQGLLRYSEVAERLGVSQKTVYQRIKAGKLKSVQFSAATVTCTCVSAIWRTISRDLEPEAMSEHQAGSALIYCRVSTIGQEQNGTSLDSQEAAGRTHAQVFG